MVRNATEADVAAILAIYAPYVLNTTVTFEYDVPTQAEFMQRFREITRQFPWLVWEEDGEILGYAYASAPYSRAAYSWCAEPSVYLLPQAQGRGIGRKLFDLLESDPLFIKADRVWLTASITALKFYEKIGYTYEGGYCHLNEENLIVMEKFPARR